VIRLYAWGFDREHLKHFVSGEESFPVFIVCFTWLRVIGFNPVTTGLRDAQPEHDTLIHHGNTMFSDGGGSDSSGQFSDLAE
jgi:hypothetical protein